MADLKINTAAAAEAAESIRRINQEIDEGFSAVLEAISDLEESWNGEAAAYAISKFEELRRGFVSQRKAVLNNYANYLHGQVELGYEETENANQSVGITLDDVF